MSIASFLTASNGLANINRAFAVVSQNVANASTTDYAREVSTQTDVTAGGQGMGVRSGPTTRQVNDQLQGDVFDQGGKVAGLQVRQAALQIIDTVQGQTGSGTDLGSLLGTLQDSFSALQTDPSSATQQTRVVSAAQSLAGQINALGDAYTSGRQSAQNSIVAGVQGLNANIAQLGVQSTAIIKLKLAGQSTADLENQRDQTLDAISSQIQVKFLGQPNGDMIALTSSGLDLPIHSSGPVFTTANSTLTPATAYPGNVPAITMNGVDVTAQLQGGSLGAEITLRDATLPADAAQLDEFAQTLATRMDAQGMTMFTDANGAVPASGGTPVQSGYVGFASVVQVNPAVIADPTLVRDGTHAVTGSIAGASAFIVNPTNGPAGFTGLITRVLGFAFGSQAQSGVTQPLPATTGLGVTGTLSAPYSPPADLAGFASALVGAQSSESAQASGQLTNAASLQTALQGKLTASDGVSIDTEMSNMLQLQTAYSANAKVMTAIQTLWAQLLQMVQ